MRTAAARADEPVDTRSDVAANTTGNIVRCDNEVTGAGVGFADTAGVD